MQSADSAGADFAWSCCPRAALVKVLQLAGDKFGFRFRVGYESEFTLLRAAEPGSQVPFKAVDSSVYAQSSAFNAMAPGELQCDSWLYLTGLATQRGWSAVFRA